MLLDKSRDITTEIAKDGSWGVHAPKHLKQRAKTAPGLPSKAQSILRRSRQVSKRPHLFQPSIPIPTGIGGPGIRTKKEL